MILLLLLLCVCTKVKPVDNVPNNYNFSSFSCNVNAGFTEMHFYQHQNISNWKFPKFPSNVYNGVTFCRDREVIRIPVYNNFTTIPCWTTHAVNQKNTIKLYKVVTSYTEGSPQTELKPIANETILEYMHDVGFKYSINDVDINSPTNSSTHLGTYICLFANTSGESYVITELLKDEYFVNLTGSFDTCSLEFYANHRKFAFYCQVREEYFENVFEWYYQINTTTKCLKVSQDERRTPYKHNEFIGEKLNVKFPNSYITGLICRALKKNSTEWAYGSIKLKVKNAKEPFIRDAGVTSRLYYKPRMNLTCVVEADLLVDPVIWYRDGNRIDQHDIKTNYANSSVSTLFNITNPDNTANYTCSFQSVGGKASKTFLVLKSNSWDSQYYFILAIIIFGTICILLLQIWCKYKDKQKKHAFNLIVSELRKADFGHSELQIDYANSECIGCGQYGKVYKTTVQCGSLQVVAAIKKFRWTFQVNLFQAELLCKDFLQEIRTLQILHESTNEHIVRYFGFDAQDMEFYRINLVLEFCEPGELEKFLRECHEEDNYEYDHGLPPDNEASYYRLCISHLIKWLEQIVLALQYIHKHNIVHRDLATRNFLLQVLQGGNPRNPNDLAVKISDFGMARILATRNENETKPYIIQNKSTKREKIKPRCIPAFWYAPEALGRTAEYRFESDIYSLGCMVWEMFTLSTKKPFYDCCLAPGESIEENLKKNKEDGKRPLWEDLQIIMPERLWKLINKCWECDFNSRPNLSYIYEELSQISTEIHRQNAMQIPVVNINEGDEEEEVQIGDNPMVATESDHSEEEGDNNVSGNSPYVTIGDIPASGTESDEGSRTFSVHLDHRREQVQVVAMGRDYQHSEGEGFKNEVVAHL